MWKEGGLLGGNLGGGRLVDVEVGNRKEKLLVWN